jgi:hypothetical protein
VDQRDWDAGARRHATENWSTQQSPESPEKPQSGIADTGSLQPSPEALAWAQRSEAWAQPSPAGEEPPAGRQAYPVDGVGWRTEAAEWLAAEQTARWRQTTEWRSASGDHGWRSTTEAWQTGGNAEGFRPPVDPDGRRPLAISSTAWATDQPAGPEPAQTYVTPPQTFTTQGSPQGWQQFNGGAPWQPAPDPRPAWQQFTTPTPPTDPPGNHASNGGAPSADSADTVSTPPWQRVVPPPPTTPPVDPASTWQQSVAMPAQRNGDGSSWQHLVEPARPGTYTSSRSTGSEENDPPDEPWRTSAVGVAGVGNGRAAGRRRAPEEEPPGTAWEPADDMPTWRDWADAPGARHAERYAQRDDAEPPSRHRSDAPRWDDADDDGDWDARNGAAARWHRPEPDSGSWSRGEEPRTVNWRRRRAQPDDDTDAPGWRDAGPHTDGWRRDVRPAADPWAQHARDTGFIPMSWDEPGTHGGSWRADPEERDYRVHHRTEEEPALDPAVWRRDPERLADDGDYYAGPPPVGEAATEVRRRIDPETWQRGPAPNGAATYRGGSSGDWRRELAGETELADGEARRFGTQDFVPFRPAGSPEPPAPAPAYGSAEPPAPAPAYGSPMPRAPVGRSNGARWHEPPDTQWPPRDAVPSPYERRAGGFGAATSGRSNLLEPEDDIDDNDRGGPLAAVGYTVIWYGVPVVLFLLYMLLVTGDEKAHALNTLANAAPKFGLSLALSMLVAVLLRWISGSWKAVSVGLAAAVMGGGLATVLASVITGNSLS